MKLRALLERDYTYPVSVQYEQEYTNADGEVDVEEDPYATGDSPSLSSFEPTAVFVTDTKEQLDLAAFLKSLTPALYEWITSEALELA
jgi:hypothetical protein